jgi:phage/plasmid-like protein (TIGR03299 family)
MSANINFNAKTGSFSFVAAVKPAWHGLGTILPNRFTSAEAMEYANLNYHVGLAPIHMSIENGVNESTKVLIDDKYCTYRADTNVPFGIVGSKYEVVQNREAFSFFDSIVGENKAIYETAGALGKGEIIFLTAKLPDGIVLPGDDLIEKYLVLSMSHDGSKAITAMFTPTRVVCANTLAVAMANGSHKVTIKHTASAHDKLAEASKLMGLVQKSTHHIHEVILAMAKKPINDDQLAEYIKFVFLTPEQRKNLAETGDHTKSGISDRVLTTMDSVYDYSLSGIGQNMISTRGTLFGAYSGVTSWLFNQKEYRSTESRMKSLILEGTDYELNNKAYNIAANLLKTL